MQKKTMGYVCADRHGSRRGRIVDIKDHAKRLCKVRGLNLSDCGELLIGSSYVCGAPPPKFSKLRLAYLVTLGLKRENMGDRKNV